MAVTKTNEEVILFVLKATGADNARIDKKVGEFLEITLAFPDGVGTSSFEICFVGQEDDELFGIGAGLHLSR